jgi:hypothetical protein
MNTEMRIRSGSVPTQRGTDARGETGLDRSPRTYHEPRCLASAARRRDGEGIRAGADVSLAGGADLACWLAPPNQNAALFSQGC